MEKIYCISGLGADHRLFAHLSIPGYILVPLPWVPHEPKDTLASYAVKMAQQIPEQDPIILGLSFGGMLAAEIACRIPVKKTILISSAKIRTEVGFRSFIYKGLNSILPVGLFPRPYSVILYYLGADTDEEKAMLKDMLDHGNIPFTKWCVGAILGWDATSCPASVFQLHGTADRVIVPANVKPDHWIKDGSHIMIYNRAAKVSALISDYLER